MNINYRQACCTQPFGHLRPGRIHGYTIFGDNYVNRLARSNQCRNLRNHAGDTSAKKRADDNRKSAVCGSILMPPDSSANDTVGAHEHVYIEIFIYLQCGKDDNVKSVNGRALVHPAGIIHRRNLLMERIRLDGFSSNFVE